MPRKKLRKKVKVKINPIIKGEFDQERYENDGVEFIRTGNKIFLNNNRTNEQQIKYLQELSEGRQNQLDVIEKLIKRVENVFQKCNPIKLLGGLAYYNICHPLKNQDNLSEVSLEYGLSFATAIKPSINKDPTPKIINELIKLLEKIRNEYSRYSMSESLTGKYSEIENKIRHKTILEALYVRGDGYTEHIYSIFKELFSGHDNLLTEKYGFTSNELLECIIQLENSFACRLILPHNKIHPAVHHRFKEWANLENERKVLSEDRDFIDLFGEDNPDIVIKDKKIVGFKIDDINDYEDLFKIRFRNSSQKVIIEAISQVFGENSNFLNPKFKALPLNETLITTNPIIKHNDDHYIFSFALPMRNIFNITENLIKKADVKYYNEKFIGKSYSLSRDNYLESKTTELFEKLIPKSEFYTNCKYRTKDENGNDYETELDLLIFSNNAIYLVEMKSGSLNSAAKRGALKSLTGKLREVVGYGAYQNFRALEYILNTTKPVFKTSDGEEITIDKTKRIFRITITFEHLAGLIAYMYDLKELGVIDNNVDFAWTCSIFDLMIFSDILESENDFIDYLELRIKLYQRPEMTILDEIDLLGYFLEENLEFDESMIKDLTHFQLNGFADEINNYFEKSGVKPKRNAPSF